MTDQDIIDQAARVLTIAELGRDDGTTLDICRFYAEALADAGKLADPEVVREALADAWDDGHEWGAHNEHEFRPGKKIANPWRDEPNKGGDQ